MRTRDDWRNIFDAAGNLAAYACLATAWLALLWNFFSVMAPRFGGLLQSAPFANTPPCNSPDCDFSMFWTAGRLGRLGQFAALYHPASFESWRHQLLSAAAQRLDWFYPPPALLPAMAIAILPFHLAFLVWTFGFAVVAALILRWAGLSWLVIGLGLLSPAALWNFEMGQLQVFCGACMVAGLLMLERAPWRAGMLLGCLLFKPQTGLLAPLSVLMRRNARAIAAGLITVLLIAAAAGWPAWHQYFTYGAPAARQTLTTPHPIGAERGISVFWMIRVAGYSLTTAYATQAATALAAAALNIHAWRRPGTSGTDRMALTVLLSLLATPYGYVDDMVAYSFALAAVVEARAWRISLLDVVLFLWPAICPVVYFKTGLLLTPVIVALAAGRIYWRMRKQGVLF